MVIDGKDFALDLLFFHRKLRRMVAVELKLEEFQAADKGQMELYLRWLDRHEREPGEEPPVGLILCESAGAEQIELLQLGDSGIRVATYLTDLPPKAIPECPRAVGLTRPHLPSPEPRIPDRDHGVAGILVLNWVAGILVPISFAVPLTS
jgi:hypothetical protein